MRIDAFTVQNFKKFKEQTFALRPQFTLLIGENGSGKTSILDALAVALGIWLVEPPDTTLAASGRNILTTEIRLEPSRTGDRILFREHRPVVVSATGQIGDHDHVTWLRQIREDGRRTTNADAKDALAIIKDIYRRDLAGEQVLCPVIAYYGAGRAWLPSNERTTTGKPNGAARRWAGFYDCLNERIRLTDLQRWFQSEMIAAAHEGRMRAGFEIVRRVIVGCIPGADNVWFDPDREQIVLSIGDHAQPFDNLSAGQRMMLAIVADIAIKAVTQNTYLVPERGLGQQDASLPLLLQRTPGVVLIDEIDVHLHPRWQRRVVGDLMRNFPAIQFVCTSHSPQVIGMLSRESVVLLNDDETWQHPVVGTRGSESNEILNYVMGATDQDPEADRLEREIDAAIDAEDLQHMEDLYRKFLEVTEEPTIQRHRIRALIENERTLREAAE